jgi:hypothetical protein
MKERMIAHSIHCTIPNGICMHVEPSSNIILHLVMCYGYHIGVDGTARTFFSRHDEVKVSVSIIPAVSKLASSSWQPGRVKLSSERIQMDTASYRKTTCFTYVAVAYLSDPAVSVQYTYYIILFCFEKMCLSIYVRWWSLLVSTVHCRVCFYPLHCFIAQLVTATLLNSICAM